MNPYVAFVVAAVVTYALRSSMTLAGGRIVRSDRITDFTKLVTPAVLAVMIAGALATNHGRSASPEISELAAVGTAFVVTRKVGNFGVALAAGVAIYWAVRSVGLG